MAHNIDFNALKARTMGSGDNEEAVTVDTRGLISKVLSRYSGKWTVLREMIQNAADASATRVTVKFETLPSTTIPLPHPVDSTTMIKHVLTHHTLKRLLISNNGHSFTEKDWGRLKRIADGNPDETKIGAFGVGFYSVFDDCEEPFVSSGSEAMAFYWKGNALFTRRLRLDQSDVTPDTTFVLDYRNHTTPVPALLPLCQFLATSLTFVGLEGIDLWIDDWNLLQLHKKTAPSAEINIPRDIDTKTPEGLMKIQSVKREVAQVDAKWMNAVEWKGLPSSSSRVEGLRDTTTSLRTFFSKFTSNSSAQLDKQTKLENPEKSRQDEDLATVSTASVFLHITTASIQASISSALSSELERATRKPPPKRTTLAILTPSYTADMSSSQSQVLDSVLPSKSGRVFIGFPTHQTTGLNAHISAPSVIPTVERESIDLNTRYISKWNLEMLRAAGIVCRIAWSANMSSVQSRLHKFGNQGKGQIRKDDITALVPEAIHTANQFVFRESTPSTQLGQTIEDSFWMCNKNASIEILSTCGVMPSHQVRLAPKDLSFMEGIPSLPENLVLYAKDFVKKLTDFGLVTEVTVSDVKRGLEANALTSRQLSEFLAWLGKRSSTGTLDMDTVKALLSVAVANIESTDKGSGRLLVLADIQCYVNASKIPADMPMPPYVMPFEFTKSVAKSQLESLGWSEMQIVPWLRWLIDEAGNRNALAADQDMTASPAFSAKVLPIVSKQWDSLGDNSKQSVTRLLQPQTVIPCKTGVMRRPGDAYFPSVQLFDDLPIISLNGVKEKFLLALGVRKTVELGVIFERLLVENEPNQKDGTGKRKWSHVDLIKYLASVREDIPAQDIERLKNTKICTAEASDVTAQKQKRFKISELFEPKDSLRKLDLAILEWPGTYIPTSKEGRFLSTLGLRRYPDPAELLQIMAKASMDKKPALQQKAMGYFINEYHANGYASFDSSSVTTAYLPVEGANHLSNPSNCFTHDGALLFGFSLLKRELHPHAAKFGVREHPPIGSCVTILINSPPNTPQEARDKFSYLAGRIPELSKADQERLGQAKIVPISSRALSEKALRTRHVDPKSCYLGDSEDYKDIFDFVDFGHQANVFLMAIGSKQQPTKVEVARMLAHEPARTLSKLQSPDKYLNLLRSVAESMSTLKRYKELLGELKRSPCLLASRELASPDQKQPRAEAVEIDEFDDNFDDEDQGIKEWRLAAAKDIVVVDDYQSFTLFKEHILAAPQEEVLENFYTALGTPFLSNVVEERAHWGSKSSDQRPAMKLQKLIVERSRLFLHDQSPDSVRHDTKYLEKHLKIQVVHSISVRRSLKNSNASHNQKRNAIITQQGSDWMLWISPGKYDLYEISQALVHLLLRKPRLHSTLTLEMLLKTDLLELRARGYNVERILRQKAHEARIAEDRRQKQLEEETRQIQEREAEWLKTQAQARPELDDSERGQHTMPGLFPDSPTNRRTSQEQNPAMQNDGDHELRPRGLFSNLTRRLGIDDGGRASKSLHSLFQGSSSPSQTPESGSSDAPPPYSADDPHKRHTGGTGTVTSPHALEKNLLSAVQACRPNGSSGVYSPPNTNQVTETKSYCDEQPSHDLEFAATLPSGINVLVIKTISDRSRFLSEHAVGIQTFATLLEECAKIFAVRVNCISIFYDSGGKTIAFNRGGSLFCNYLYFEQLHERQLAKDPATGRADALVYWWVILCHELAHNLVESHSSEHSYYTEGFVIQYFPKLARLLGNKPSLKGT